MLLLSRFFGLLVPLLDCFCIYHVIRTGRDRTWFYLILFVPVIGSLIYLFSEVFPHVHWDHVVDLNLGFLHFFKKRRLDRLADTAEYAPTVHNRTAYADALAEQGQPEHAIEIYQECLTGPLKDDMHILFALAEVQADAGAWKGLLATLDRLRPEDAMKNEDRILRFRALALENTNRVEEALAAYHELLPRWTGEEIRCRLARLLLTQNRDEEAMRLLDEVTRNARRGASHYRRVNHHWIKYARDVIKSESKAAKAQSATAGVAPRPEA